MARLSDIIENFIKDMLERTDKDFLEIQRNELANVFNCAPSQINYVIATRFTVNRGYYVESKRGGGGCIKIRRVDIDKNDYIREAIWNNIGDEITQQEGESYIDLFMERGFITEREAKLMKAVINDKTINIQGQARDIIRAHILKTMLITMIE